MHSASKESHGVFTDQYDFSTFLKKTVRPLELSAFVIFYVSFGLNTSFKAHGLPGGGTLGISGWGCAAGTSEPLTYTRVSSAEFCYPILE